MINNILNNNPANILNNLGLNEIEEEGEEYAEDDLPELEPLANNQTDNIPNNLIQPANIFPQMYISPNLTLYNNINDIPRTYYNVFNIINNPRTPENSMEDVVVTLRDEDFCNIIKRKLITSSEEKCSICRSCYEEDNDVSTLKCSHEFHTGCIEPWLRNYNYKCPICRTECGEVTYNNM